MKEEKEKEKDLTFDTEQLRKQLDEVVTENENLRRELQRIQQNEITFMNALIALSNKIKN